MKRIFFVGAYTNPGSGAIRRLEIDPQAETIRELAPLLGVGNPIYFAMTSSRRHLYVAQSENGWSSRVMGGTLAHYEVLEERVPKLLETRTFPITVPCHISLSPAEDKLFFAEYGYAHAGMIDLKSDGTFAHSIHVVHREGFGPNQVRQEAAHCHCAMATPDGKTLYVCDLGTDTIAAYDLTQSVLVPKPSFSVQCKPGYGPRHLVFRADGKRAYVVYELGNAVQAFSVREDGALISLGEPVSTLPFGFVGETKAAAIRISPCGRWVLASNRGYDSIAAIRLNGEGKLEGEAVISLLAGHFPRDFVFVEDRHLLVGHKLSDTVGLYRWDGDTGKLSLQTTIDMQRPLAFVES